MNRVNFEDKLQSLRLAEAGSFSASDFKTANSERHFLANSFTSPQSSFFRSKVASRFTKSAPIVGFLAILIVILVIIGFFLTPSLLINHFVQMVTDTFNYQAPSLEARSNMLLNTKWADGSQTSQYKIINDYRQIPDNLVKNLESEGFTIRTDNGQITEVFFKNKPIARDQFLNLLQTNLDINEAKNNSFNAKRVVFQDSVWQKNARNLRLSKAGFTQPNSSDQAEIINDFKQQELAITKVDDEQMRFNTEVPTETDEQGNTHEQQSPSISIFKSLTSNLKYINQQADQTSEQQEAPFYRSFDNLRLVESDFINNQSGCGLRQNGLFLQNYAKQTQAAQQSQLAFTLFVEAEKIKAGIATPESTAFYGDRLTKTFTTTKKNGVVVETKSATDSLGYKYAAYGDISELDESAERYVLGANPTVAKILSNTEDSAQDCQNEGGFFKKLFRNFFSNIANLLAPLKIKLPLIDELLNSGRDRQLTENTVASMANLKVAPNTAGDDLGNAIVSAAGYAFGKNAAIGGNTILTKKQATAYLNEQQSYIAFQGKIETKNLSPLNTSSRHTLMGNLVASNLHLFSQASSIRSFAQSLIKSANLSLLKLSPISSAKKSAVNHNICQDSEFLKLNQHLNGEEIAFDIFCNPIYGIDVNFLNKSPIEVVNQLISSGDLVKANPDCQENCELIPDAGLAKFEKNCINRAKLPIGDEDEENGFDDGESCIANSDQKTLYGLFFIDQRLQKIFTEIKPLQ